MFMFAKICLYFPYPCLVLNRIYGKSCKPNVTPSPDLRNPNKSVLWTNDLKY